MEEVSESLYCIQSREEGLSAHSTSLSDAALCHFSHRLDAPKQMSLGMGERRGNDTAVVRAVEKHLPKDSLCHTQCQVLLKGAYNCK